ncbi:LmbU family transcriptional regulator [Nocardia brasiliensis]|uniref:LmbU family transcriptional regulator n=1 Tax=Nocardia brasiliensis TaxID=37326 RepID=UPI00366AB670
MGSLVRGGEDLGISVDCDRPEGKVISWREPRAQQLLAGAIFGSGPDQGGRARPTGLILPHSLTYESWREIGSKIFTIANSSAWWVGDWLIYGEDEFGNRYEQAIKETSFRYQTLRNCAWVARKFPMSRRRDRLSFGHHAEVAALIEVEQDTWLARAERLQWSRNELRRRLRAAQMVERNGRDGVIKLPKLASPLKIDLTYERQEHWRTAAERANCDNLADWVVGTLDRAAREILE